MDDLMECPGPCEKDQVCWCGEKAELSFGTVQRFMEKLKESSANVSEVSEQGVQWKIVEMLIDAAYEVADDIYEYEPLGIEWEKRFDAWWHFRKMAINQLHHIHSCRSPKDDRFLLPQPPIPPTATVVPFSRT